MRGLPQIASVVVGLGVVAATLAPGLVEGPGDADVGPVTGAAPAVAVGGRGLQEARDSFPHLEHEGLFPLCTGCHTGITDGDEGDFYPEPSVCAGCHDGVDQVEVDWAGPPPDVPDLLAFSHPVHIAEVAEAGDEPLDCRQCHTPAGGSRMQVEPLQAEGCLSCHGHPAEEHVVDADCSTCHIPLAESELSGERIAGLYQPPSHDAGDLFILELHGDEAEAGTARCTTCHTRETCTSCHVTGNSAIDELPVAPPGMELPTRTAAYPVPPSHAAEDFEITHGEIASEATCGTCHTQNDCTSCHVTGHPAIDELSAAAPGMERPARTAPYPVPASHAAADFENAHGEIASVESCGTCHTQNDCASCHLPPLPRVARDLPRAEQVEAPGVGLMVDAPATHAAPWFREDHSSLAIANDASCASCHTEPFCASCHEAPDRPVFHPENYLSRHAADAWGATAECASCHEVETTCRACHTQVGRRAEGRLEPGYHDAEPLWLLRHGQAARQSLESCASCHTQRNCLQCHSTTGAFQVNPHGSGFDAARARERNPLICRACHTGNPLGDGG